MTELSEQTNLSGSVAPTSQDAQVTQNSGKYLSQDEIDKLVHASKMKGREQAQRELQSSAQSSAPAQNIPDIDSIVEKKLQEKYQLQQQRQLAEDAENKRKALESRVEQSLTEVTPKILAAKKKYADFDSVVNEAGIDQNPLLAIFANEVPNSGEVIYELSNSPQKLATFNLLASKDSTAKAALKFIKGISDAISQNQEAVSKNKLPSSPLKSIKPSPVASSGKKSWKGFYKGKL